jgi:hypothetical protein
MPELKALDSDLLRGDKRIKKLLTTENFLDDLFM